MQIFFWVLAFVGVALIYPVPIIAGKLGAGSNIKAGIKLAGVILAIISLLVLNGLGEFNR